MKKLNIKDLYNYYKVKDITKEKELKKYSNMY